MENLKLTGALIGLMANIPLFYQVLYKGLEQNFSTWILWCCLDVIVTIGNFRQHGDWQLSGCYIVTSFAMACVLYYKKQIEWTKTDTWTARGVAVCLVCWFIVGDKAATVAGTTAVVISAFPLIKETFFKPSRSTAIVYFLFCIASGTELYAAQSWNVEKALYPGGTLSFSIILTLLSLRKIKPHLKIAT